MRRAVMATNEEHTITEDEKEKAAAPISESATSDVTGTENAHRTHEERWEEAFQRLLVYRRTNGHCNVPFRYEKDPHLGRWVSLQRSVYKAESQNSNIDRVAKLNEIGFDWAPKDPRSVSWELRYRELVAYVQKYGNAKVPLGWKENIQLANWVSAQRREYKRLLEGNPSRLTAERIESLNRINFVWKVLARTAKRNRDESDNSSDRSEANRDRKPAAAVGSGLASGPALGQPASQVSFARHDTLASISGNERNIALRADPSAYVWLGGVSGQSINTLQPSQFLSRTQMPYLSQLLHPSQSVSPYTTSQLPAVQLQSLRPVIPSPPPNEMSALFPYLRGHSNHLAAHPISRLGDNPTYHDNSAVTHDTRFHNLLHLGARGSNAAPHLLQRPQAFQIQSVFPLAVPTSTNPAAAAAAAAAAPPPPGYALVPWSLMPQVLAASSQQQVSIGTAAFPSGTGMDPTERGQAGHSPAQDSP